MGEFQDHSGHEMGARAKTYQFNDLLEKIVSNNRSGNAVLGRSDSMSRLTALVRKLIEHDYRRSLRRCLRYHHVQTLLADFREIFPEFNYRPVEMLTTARFAEIARALRFHIKTAPLEGAAGFALRGFYVASTTGLLKLPLIYVNTAHHPLAAMTTFLHELGHHQSCSLLDIKHRGLHLFDTDYREHLSDPAELAADIVVSLAGYPEPAARMLFAGQWVQSLDARAGELSAAAIEEVHDHLARTYGLDLAVAMPPANRLHYLAGMIHFAKLRVAMLAEYGL